MADTETLFCLDPAVLMKVTEVNHFPVLDRATDGNRTFVLCMRPFGPAEFVTWSIWRTESGEIAAEHGHYMGDLGEAVVDLRYRARDLAGIKALAFEAGAEAARLAREQGL